MQRVVIVDYGSGNLHSARKAVERAAREADMTASVAVSADADAVAAADRVILPGVGAFADCAAGLAAVPGMIEALNTFAIERGKPFLGICVGMQLMANARPRVRRNAGLGWIDGDVTMIEPKDAALKVPHMGWNTLSVSREHALLDGIALGADGRHAYFVHSYQLMASHRMPSSQPLTTAGRSRQWSAATTSSAHSFIRRKVRSSACDFYQLLELDG